MLILPGVAVVAIAGLAAGQARASLPACTVTWTGGGSNNLWSNPSNWSTGAVPGSASDVCINTFTFVGATPPISVHSLQVSNGASLYFNGGPSGANINIATVLSNDAYLTLEAPYSLTAGTIHNPGDIDVLGDSTITSPAFSNTGTLAAIDATVRLVDAPRQLKTGVLSGGTWDALNGPIVLPTDVTAISGADVALGQGGAGLRDASGNNALAVLSSIGPTGRLSIDGQGSLALSGNLVSQGFVELGSYDDGGTLSIAGTYTQQQGGSTVLFQSTLAAKTVTVGAGSSLTGNGTISGPLVNQGTVAAAGVLSVDGSFKQTSAATLTSYFNTTLGVSGSAALAGALDLVVNTRCPPPQGSKYTALSYGSRSGSFSTHTSGFGLSYGSTALTVTYKGPSGTC